MAGLGGGASGQAQDCTSSGPENSGVLLRGCSVILEGAARAASPHLELRCSPLPRLAHQGERSFTPGGNFLFKCLLSTEPWGGERGEGSGGREWGAESPRSVVPMGDPPSFFQECLELSLSFSEHLLTALGPWHSRCRLHAHPLSAQLLGYRAGDLWEGSLAPLSPRC